MCRPYLCLSFQLKPCSPGWSESSLILDSVIENGLQRRQLGVINCLRRNTRRHHLVFPSQHVSSCVAPCIRVTDTLDELADVETVAAERLRRWLALQCPGVEKLPYVSGRGLWLPREWFLREAALGLVRCIVAISISHKAAASVHMRQPGFAEKGEARLRRQAKPSILKKQIRLKVLRYKLFSAFGIEGEPTAFHRIIRFIGRDEMLQRLTDTVQFNVPPFSIAGVRAVLCDDGPVPLASKLHGLFMREGKPFARERLIERLNLLGNVAVTVPRLTWFFRAKRYLDELADRDGPAFSINGEA